MTTRTAGEPCTSDNVQVLQEYADALLSNHAHEAKKDVGSSLLTEPGGNSLTTNGNSQAKESSGLKQMRRAQSAIELRSLHMQVVLVLQWRCSRLYVGRCKVSSPTDWCAAMQAKSADAGVELTTPEGQAYTVGTLSPSERMQKIMRCAAH